MSWDDLLVGISATGIAIYVIKSRKARRDPKVRRVGWWLLGAAMVILIATVFGRFFPWPRALDAIVGSSFLALLIFYILAFRRTRETWKEYVERFDREQEEHRLRMPRLVHELQLRIQEFTENRDAKSVLHHSAVEAAESLDALRRNKEATNTDEALGILARFYYARFLAGSENDGGGRDRQRAILYFRELDQRDLIPDELLGEVYPTVEPSDGSAR